MEQLQNEKKAYPLFLEDASKKQDSQEGFLDLEDILYPQRKELNQSNNCIVQESIAQITHQTPTLPENQQITLPIPNKMVQLQEHINQKNHIFENQMRNQRKISKCRQSNKHNFPKHLVRKIKDLMKKILNLKKKGKIDQVSSWRTLYFYYFHENLRKYQNIQILHLFLEHKDQISSLENDFKLQAEKHGMQREINLEFVNSLRLQLRKTLIQQQSYLFSLIEKGQIGRKQEFIDFIKQFLNDIKQGIVRSTHK